MTAALPTGRYVEHLMGMPISLALRGRHAGNDVGRAAWAEVMAVLHDVDRVFSTYRADSAAISPPGPQRGSGTGFVDHKRYENQISKCFQARNP